MYLNGNTATFLPYSKYVVDGKYYLIFVCLYFIFADSELEIK